MVTTNSTRGVPAHLFYFPLASFHFHRPLLCVFPLPLEKGEAWSGGTMKRRFDLCGDENGSLAYERKGVLTTIHPKEGLQGANVLKSTKKNILGQMFPCGVIMVMASVFTLHTSANWMLQCLERIEGALGTPLMHSTTFDSVLCPY